MSSVQHVFRPLHQPVAHTDCASFIFRGNELLVSETDWRLPDLGSCAPLEIPVERFHAVGIFDEQYCRCAWVDRNAAPVAGFHFVPLRAVIFADMGGILSLAGRAFQIVEWARTHRYCGSCGSKTVLVSNERCMRCSACETIAYPRISPAMMVLITRGDQALLARHAVSPTQRFSALAGFLESGESVEDAVHREVAEEVGLRVHRLRYFGSQSWPFPHSLMIAFTAEYQSGEICIDPQEIAEARWFSRGEQMPDVASTVSIAGHLIRSHFGPLP